ncbi:MAG TPA: hypothetical protein VKP61_02985 [Candidatus Acidoferrum sp.]|nr:hypothetical protein [Candidatus Acidoferrum sp.]
MAVLLAPGLASEPPSASAAPIAAIREIASRRLIGSFEVAAGIIAAVCGLPRINTSSTIK